MSIPTPVKFCPICGKRIYGTKDKIYCSVACKSTYHRERRLQAIPIANDIDAILHRNWIILQEIYESAQSRKSFINKSRLIKEGFKFEYHTTCKQNKDGKPTIMYITLVGWIFRGFHCFQLTYLNHLYHSLNNLFLH